MESSNSSASLFSSQANIKRPRFGLPDLAVGLGILVLLYVVARAGSQSLVRFSPPEVIPSVSLDPWNLPNYAARSTLRMFVALGFSTLFTFVYGYAAARSKRAERVLVPLLDILQSVPVLGFLSVTVTAFIALFRGSLLGLEAASVFAIFTGQAWNMTFSFYQSLRSVPNELDEMAGLYRLSAWERFTRLELPASMIGLVWNGMMSFGGGWFFLTVSEALSVNNHKFALPGIGSYVAAASEEGDLTKVLLAIAVMIVVIISVNALFWRPLTAWVERFRIEESESVEAPRSVTLEVLRRSRIPGLIGAPLSRLIDPVDRVTAVFGVTSRPLKTSAMRRRFGDAVSSLAVAVALGYGAIRVSAYVADSVGFAEVGHAALLGLATFARVVVVVVFSTLIWVPIGVWIGLNPKVCRLAQPVIQVLASFPANFLFPLFTALLLATGISLNVGGIVLMTLGTQWYILFNVIAGASAIPNELREASASLRLPTLLRWRTLILPGIFGSYVTGGITAAGGAWNASIVAEVVQYHSTTLTADGLGAYITQATTVGDAPRLLLGVIIMSFYVVTTNVTVWQRLYALSERRFSLS